MSQPPPYGNPEGYPQSAWGRLADQGSGGHPAPQYGYQPPAQPGYGQPPGYGQQPAYGGGPGYPPAAYGNAGTPRGSAGRGWSAALFLIAGLATLLPPLMADLGVDPGPLGTGLFGVLWFVQFGVSTAAKIVIYGFGVVVVLMAALMFGRVAVARWVLIVCGLVAVAYYTHVLIFFVGQGGFSDIEFVLFPIGLLVMWVVATILAFLPSTARAMSSSRR